MIQTESVELMGQRWIAKSKHGNPWMLNIDFNFKDDVEPHELDWSKLPGDDFRIQGRPVNVRVSLRNGDMCMFDTMTELREYGEKLLQAHIQPNTARIAKIRKNLKYYQTRYRESLERKRIILNFIHNHEKQSWQAVKMEDWRGGKYRVVYTVQSGRNEYQERFEPGVLYACEVLRTAVDNPPQGSRPGFRLVVVTPYGEHFDPDAEIARLEREIAAGRL